MTVPEDVNNKSTRFYGKRILLAIIIILIAGLAFGLSYFFMTGSGNVIKNNDAFLPSNCYSVNGKQTCVSHKS